ncbi:hypothetical protein L1987_53354 [Smallanthus sonchifolius]|uniref:Uncharacterized protein n=1 Tax=Smallanthus sonchifolius TaxID=185202 RepID=A0ACB9EWV6_9ASTR|nr:hypothetical protein L1987_53354 [Smallanthus sonchifolius]
MLTAIYLLPPSHLPGRRNRAESHVQERKMEGERRRDIRFSTSSRSRRTISLSPLGTSDQRRQQVVLSSLTPSSENGSRRWSFLDLFLFRNDSDGRAMDRDPLKKYFADFQKYDQDIMNSGSVSKRRGEYQLMSSITM